MSDEPNKQTFTHQIEEVYRLCNRWLNRPHSVTYGWLANDADMFAKLRVIIRGEDPSPILPASTVESTRKFADMLRDIFHRANREAQSSGYGSRTAAEVTDLAWYAVAKEIERLYEGARAEQDKPTPIPMLLWCPGCSERHIDVDDFATKPHHTHACQSCGMVWRPAKVDTVGVDFLPGYKNA